MKGPECALPDPYAADRGKSGGNQKVPAWSKAEPGEFPVVSMRRLGFELTFATITRVERVVAVASHVSRSHHNLY